MESELIIYSNKKAYKIICLVLFVLNALLSFAFVSVKNHLSAGLLCTLSQVILIMLMAGLTCMFIYSLYRIARIAPMAVINQNGIWIKQFGIIPWNNIFEVTAFPAPNAPSIGIQVRDAALLSKQASIAGKLIMFESKMLHCPTIVIDNLEVNSQTIISFANEFIQEIKQ